MSDLIEKINARCEARAQDDLFLRHADAVAVIRSVLELCESEPSSLIDTDDLLEVVASALGVCVDQPEKD